MGLEEVSISFLLFWVLNCGCWVYGRVNVGMSWGNDCVVSRFLFDLEEREREPIWSCGFWIYEDVYDSKRLIERGKWVGGMILFSRFLFDWGTGGGGKALFKGFIWFGWWGMVPGYIKIVTYHCVSYLILFWAMCVCFISLVCVCVSYPRHALVVSMQHLGIIGDGRFPLRFSSSLKKSFSESIYF